LLSFSALRYASLATTILFGAQLVEAQTVVLPKGHSAPSAGSGLLRLPESPSGKKSVLVAVAASLVLPGVGELYAGNFESGRYFLVADALLWLGYGGTITQSNWIRRDARLYAVQHAGASMNGKDEQFEVNIGNFLSTDDYNQAKLRNREFDLVYRGAQDAWLWDSDASRTRFRDLRIRSDEWKQASTFVVAALVVNRIISAFNAGRAAGRANRPAETTGSLDVDVAVVPYTITSHQGISVQLCSRF